MKHFILLLLIVVIACGAKKDKKSELEHHDKMQGATVDEVIEDAITLAESQMERDHCIKAFARFRHKRNNKMPSKQFHKRITYTRSEFIQGSPFAFAAVNCFEPNNVMISEYWTRINGVEPLAVALIHEYAHTLQCKEWLKAVKKQPTKEEFDAMNVVHEMEAQELAMECVTEPAETMLPHFEGDEMKMPRYGWLSDGVH